MLSYFKIHPSNHTGKVVAVVGVCRRGAL